MHTDGIITVDATLNFATGQKEVWLKIENSSCFLTPDEAHSLADAVDSKGDFTIKEVAISWTPDGALRVTLGDSAAHPSVSLFFADWVREAAEEAER
jgi:hypothetical protein